MEQETKFASKHVTDDVGGTIQLHWKFGSNKWGKAKVDKLIFGNVKKESVSCGPRSDSVSCKGF